MLERLSCETGYCGHFKKAIAVPRVQKFVRD